jgi:hypothetical protein
VGVNFTELMPHDIDPQRIPIHNLSLFVSFLLKEQKRKRGNRPDE